MATVYQKCYTVAMPDQIEKQLPPIEMPPTPESGKEAKKESSAAREEAPISEQLSEAAPATPVVLPVAAPTAPIDPTVRSIELILSEDMTEHFKAMSLADQAKFKAKGEETVSKLSMLVQKTSIKAKEVLKLIANWLRFIPHVNKYFLEQESKIKTDKILELHKREHGG
jgi:hypothetical protein